MYERGKIEVYIFSSEEVEIVMPGGKPHNEPVFAYGPIVMSSEVEIRK